MDIISGRSQDVRLGRPQDFRLGRPRDGQTGSLGDFLGTLEGNVLGKSWRPIFAGWVNTFQLLAELRKQIGKCINEIEETTFADNDCSYFIFKENHAFIKEEGNPSKKVL